MDPNHDGLGAYAVLADLIGLPTYAVAAVYRQKTVLHARVGGKPRTRRRGWNRYARALRDRILDRVRAEPNLVDAAHAAWLATHDLDTVWRVIDASQEGLNP